MTQSIRNVLIAGVPRSGKTTVARRVSKQLALSHIPLDAMVSAFEIHFPQHGIVHQNLELSQICKNFLPFLTSFLKELELENTAFCVDSYHILPEGAAKLRSELGLVTVFLGYPSISHDEKLALIRRYPVPSDWTAELGDEGMRPLIERFIDQSRFISTECRKFNLPFIDSGAKFESALDEAIQRIVAESSGSAD